MGTFVSSVLTVHCLEAPGGKACGLRRIFQGEVARLAMPSKAFASLVGLEPKDSKEILPGFDSQRCLG